jgi:hypothetical protein
MKRFVLVFAVLALAAAAPPVKLSKPAPVAKDVAGLPRLLSPATPQTASINAALARLDARARRDLAACRQADPKNAFLERSVSVDAVGARFLSLYVVEFSGCGGAHPDSSWMALTYDLATGRPINWADYLPADLVSAPALEDFGDGLKIGVLKSPALLSWYRAAVAREGARDKAWWADCKDVYDDPDLALILWIDARQDGVRVQASQLPHVVQACVSPQVLSVAELKKRGAKPALTDAIEAMRQAGGWRR